MRNFLIAAGLSLASVVWLHAQDADRVGKVDSAAQNGQNTTDGGFNQNPSSSGQNQVPNIPEAQQKALRPLIPNQAEAAQIPAAQIPTAQVSAALVPADGNTRDFNSYVITCLRADNRNEIEASRLASERAVHPEVKAFALQMLQEHSNFLVRLDQIGQSAPVGHPSDTSINVQPQRPAEPVPEPTRATQETARATQETARRNNVASGIQISSGPRPLTNATATNPDRFNAPAGSDRSPNPQSSVNSKASSPDRTNAPPGADRDPTSPSLPPSKASSPDRTNAPAGADRDQNPQGRQTVSKNDRSHASSGAGVRKFQSATPTQGNNANVADPLAPHAATSLETQTTIANASTTSGTIGQLIRMKQEMAEHCLASTQRELSEKQGNEFDKCYMGRQVVAHLHMVDSLSVFSRHATGELQQLAAAGLETAQQHVNQAKQIAKLVDGSSGIGGIIPPANVGTENVNRTQ